MLQKKQLPEEPIAKRGEVYQFGRHRLMCGIRGQGRMGLLDSIIEKNKPKEGICESCKYLIKVSDSALGCTAHDKLIMPQYPPYHGNVKCKDWALQE